MDALQTDAGSPSSGASGERSERIQLGGRLKVWIDQDLCTGDGICTDHAPEVFTLLEDGIAYCKQNGEVLNDPGGAAGLATVPLAWETRVIHAASDCPGECIFVEIDDSAAIEP